MVDKFIQTLTIIINFLNYKRQCIGSFKLNYSFKNSLDNIAVFFGVRYFYINFYTYYIFTKPFF